MESAIRDNGFGIVPIDVKHAHTLLAMPFHHRDPFDRMLVAQAMVENMSIVSNDSALDAYSVRRCW
jgi:PIN domain nuclease of toxin-antitoxin system